MRDIVRAALLVALCALVLLGCSPGQALGLLRQETQSQADQPAPGPTPGASQDADTADEAVIQVLITRGNIQQEQALASHDPSAMHDTATDRYFRQMSQTNQDLLDGNVSSIKLVGLEWGGITIRGNAAVATTYETWATTFADGHTQQSRDRNDYSLVKQNGEWKIDGDRHPDDSNTLPPGARQA